MIKSFQINYQDQFTDLCVIGAKFDMDKSPIRHKAHIGVHRHAYSCFYHEFFKNARDRTMNIAEIGIFYGASMLMWREYFKNAQIYGSDFDTNLVNAFLNKYNTTNIYTGYINMKDGASIGTYLKETNQKFDIIIEDSTHIFEDQILFVERAIDYLNEGGILIIEDIFLNEDEKRYNEKLAPFLHHFQDYYFVTLDHDNRYSAYWNNDKLLILIKKGTPLFDYESIKPQLKENLFGYVRIGESKNDRVKIIKLNKKYSSDVKVKISGHPFTDTFKTIVFEDLLIVIRTDAASGWGHDHSAFLY